MMCAPFVCPRELQNHFPDAVHFTTHAGLWIPQYAHACGGSSFPSNRPAAQRQHHRPTHARTLCLVPSSSSSPPPSSLHAAAITHATSQTHIHTESQTSTDTATTTSAPSSHERSSSKTHHLHRHRHRHIRVRAHIHILEQVILTHHIHTNTRRHRHTRAGHLPW